MVTAKYLYSQSYCMNIWQMYSMNEKSANFTLTFPRLPVIVTSGCGFFSAFWLEPQIDVITCCVVQQRNCAHVSISICRSGCIWPTMSLSLNTAVIKQRFWRSKQHTLLNQTHVDYIVDLPSSKYSDASIARNTQVHVNAIRRIEKQHSQHKTVSAKITRNRNIPADLYKQWFTEYIDTVKCLNTKDVQPWSVERCQVTLSMCTFISILQASWRTSPIDIHSLTENWQLNLSELKLQRNINLQKKISEK